MAVEREDVEEQRAPDEHHAPRDRAASTSCAGLALATDQQSRLGTSRSRQGPPLRADDARPPRVLRQAQALVRRGRTRPSPRTSGPARPSGRSSAAVRSRSALQPTGGDQQHHPVAPRSRARRRRCPASTDASVSTDLRLLPRDAARVVVGHQPRGARGDAVRPRGEVRRPVGTQTVGGTAATPASARSRARVRAPQPRPPDSPEVHQQRGACRRPPAAPRAAVTSSAVLDVVDRRRRSGDSGLPFVVGRQRRLEGVDEHGQRPAPAVRGVVNGSHVADAAARR